MTSFFVQRGGGGELSRDDGRPLVNDPLINGAYTDDI